MCNHGDAIYYLLPAAGNLLNTGARNVGQGSPEYIGNDRSDPVGIPCM